MNGRVAVLVFLGCLLLLCLSRRSGAGWSKFSGEVDVTRGIFVVLLHDGQEPVWETVERFRERAAFPAKLFFYVSSSSHKSPFREEEGPFRGGYVDTRGGGRRRILARAARSLHAQEAHFAVFSGVVPLRSWDAVLMSSLQAVPVKGAVVSQTPLRRGGHGAPADGGTLQAYQPSTFPVLLPLAPRPGVDLYTGVEFPKVGVMVRSIAASWSVLFFDVGMLRILTSRPVSPTDSDEGEEEEEDDVVEDSTLTGRLHSLGIAVFPPVASVAVSTSTEEVQGHGGGGGGEARGVTDGSRGGRRRVEAFSLGCTEGYGQQEVLQRYGTLDRYLQVKRHVRGLWEKGRG